jgi:biotin transport system substrate-specific component
MTATTPQVTLADTLWPRTQSSTNWLRLTVLAFIGTLLMAISAKINVPFYPVPMTMQTFVVLSIGMAYGWRLGGATLLLYLAEGAMGLPVFAGTPEKGIGLAYMMGPTGGYLIGFVLAATIVGYLGERGWDRNVFSTIAAMTLGTGIIFGFGVLYLGTLIGWDKPVLEYGFTPFIAGAVFKILLAAAVLPLAWKLLKRS